MSLISSPLILNLNKLLYVTFFQSKLKTKKQYLKEKQRYLPLELRPATANSIYVTLFHSIFFLKTIFKKKSIISLLYCGRRIQQCALHIGFRRSHLGSFYRML
jgi:hypothetical protein